MQDTAISILISTACFAMEVFLFSIGWNLALHPVFEMRQITIVEAFGLVLFMRSCRMQILPVMVRRSETT